jgi:hypothetical protein
MDEVGWQLWFSEVVAALDAREKSFRPRFVPRRKHRERRQRMDALKWWNQSMPSRLWVGPPAVGQKLEVLWEVFVPVTAHRRSVCPGDIERTRAKGAWRWASAYRREIPPPFQVYCVAYPEPIEHVQPPSSVILGLRSGAQIDQSALQQRIMDAAGSLAAANQASIPARIAQLE